MTKITLNRVNTIASTARYPLSDYQTKVFFRYWRRYKFVPGNIQTKIFGSDHIFEFPSDYRYTRGNVIVQALSLPDRYKIKFKYSRDYAYKVFTRWQSRYKRYLPVFAQDDRLNKIQNRWGWPDKINVKTHYLHNGRFFPYYIEGEYTPVNLYAAIKCKFCGGPAYSYCRKTNKSYSYNNFREDYIVEGSYARCYDKNCHATREWAAKTGELYEIGKKLNVQSMPGWFTRYRCEQDPELKMAIASIAMVDFAAKVKAKSEPVRT